MKIVLFFLIAMVGIYGCKKSDQSQMKTSAAAPSSVKIDSTVSLPSGQVIWEDLSVSKVSVVELQGGNDFETVLENHTFLQGYAWSYGYSYPSTFIVSQNVRWSVGPHEGNEPFLQATCYLLEKGHAGKVLWHLQLEADKGELNDPFYQTTLYGCCGAERDYTLFSLASGRKIMEYTEGSVKVSIPNTKLERFIGYKCSNTIPTEAYEEYKNDSLYMGTLSYASKDSLLSRIVFRGKPNTSIPYDMINPDSITFVVENSSDHLHGADELDLWSANLINDPMRFNDFAVQIKFSDPSDSIIVPIMRDRFAPSTLDYPWFTIRLLK